MNLSKSSIHKKAKITTFETFLQIKEFKPNFIFKTRNNFFDNAVPFLEWVSNVFKNSNPSELSKLDQYNLLEQFLKLYFYYCTLVFS